MSISVVEYIREDGSSPYRQWFNTLDVHAAVKVTTAKLRLESGNTSSIKWMRGIGEFVINWGPGYRVYLAKDGGQLIILLGGGTKSGQQKAIDNALALHAEYKRRKARLVGNQD